MADKVSVERMAAEIMKGLEDYADLTADKMKLAVTAAGKTVQKDIKDNAPKDTGAYAKSWSTKKTSEKSNSLTVTVYSKNRYQIAHLLEFGHAKRGGGRVAARPHIANAEEKGASLLEKTLKGSL